MCLLAKSHADPRQSKKYDTLLLGTAKAARGRKSSSVSIARLLAMPRLGFFWLPSPAHATPQRVEVGVVEAACSTRETFLAGL